MKLHEVVKLLREWQKAAEESAASATPGHSIGSTGGDWDAARASAFEEAADHFEDVNITLHRSALPEPFVPLAKAVVDLVQVMGLTAADLEEAMRPGNPDDVVSGHAELDALYATARKRAEDARRLVNDPDNIDKGKG